MAYWINIFHIYQPPGWSAKIINRVTKESYQPLFSALRQNPRLKITLNLTGSLTESLRRLGHKKPLNDLQQLVKNKQVELLTTAAWHPILPLLPAKLVSFELTANKKINALFFNLQKVTGCWLPELAYHPNLDKILINNGIKWIIIDEISKTAQPRASGHAHAKTKSGLGVIFRHPQASQFFFQVLNQTSQQSFTKHLFNSSPKNPLITATDGENLGHHNPRLLKIWLNLATNKNVTTATASEMMALSSPGKPLALRASSWADNHLSLKHQNPYILWYNKHNPIHLEQWRLTNLVIKIGSRQKIGLLTQVSKLIYSDQYWWASGSPWWDGRVVTKAAKNLHHFISQYGSQRQQILAKNSLANINKMVNKHNFIITQKKNHPAIMFGGEKI